mmetsp:Transcript_33490/g.99848  ORF Transcript_33490/g.99848 Transcript_33490/m.99848 type:complete len:219 (-) Transcript_33490:68-724(-)
MDVLRSFFSSGISGMLGQMTRTAKRSTSGLPSGAVSSSCACAIRPRKASRRSWSSPGMSSFGRLSRASVTLPHSSAINRGSSALASGRPAQSRQPSVAMFCRKGLAKARLVIERRSSCSNGDSSRTVTRTCPVKVMNRPRGSSVSRPTCKPGTHPLALLTSSAIPSAVRSGMRERKTVCRESVSSVSGSVSSKPSLIETALSPARSPASRGRATSRFS